MWFQRKAQIEAVCGSVRSMSSVTFQAVQSEMSREALYHNCPEALYEIPKVQSTTRTPTSTSALVQPVRRQPVAFAVLPEVRATVCAIT